MLFCNLQNRGTSAVFRLTYFEHLHVFNNDIKLSEILSEIEKPQSHRNLSTQPYLYFYINKSISSEKTWTGGIWVKGKLVHESGKT